MPRDHLLTALAKLSLTLFSRWPAVLALNTLDQSGNFNFNVHQDLVKEVLDPTSGWTGRLHTMLESEFAALTLGVASPIFLTDGDQARIKEEIARKEGCRISGRISLQKLSGKFHIASNALILQLLVEAFDRLLNMNTSHIIHEVAIGDPYPGSVNPLDNYHRVNQEPGSYKYYLKVVPTEYVYLNSSTVHTFQYSVTEYWTKFLDDSMKLPGIHFKYDMSAIAVKLREKKTGFFHFLVRLCATIGGCFALTSFANGLADRIVRGGARGVYTKM